MRQSGALAKYSATETAEVMFVRFSTFTKDELVSALLLRKGGRSHKLLKRGSTMVWNPSEEVASNQLRTKWPTTWSVYLRSNLLDMWGKQRMSRTFRAHQTQLTCFSLRFHVVRGKSTQVHMSQLLYAQNVPGTNIIKKNDQQREKFRRISSIAQPTKRLN